MNFIQNMEQCFLVQYCPVPFRMSSISGWQHALSPIIVLPKIFHLKTSETPPKWGGIASVENYCFKLYLPHVNINYTSLPYTFCILTVISWLEVLSHSLVNFMINCFVTVYVVLIVISLLTISLNSLEVYAFPL